MQVYDRIETSQKCCTWTLALQELTYDGQIDQSVSSLGRLEIDPASVEAPVGLLYVVEEQECWVRGRVEVGPMAEASRSLLAPGSGIGGSRIIPENVFVLNIRYFSGDWNFPP